MGTPPQPPNPPVAPPPPRTTSHVVAIALLILAVIVVVSAASVWVGLRFLSSSVQVHVGETKSGEKEVSIKTPVGTFEAAKDVNEGSLGLPIYPGSKRLRDKGSVSLNFDFPGGEGVRVAVAKYETPDSLEKVRDFYKSRLGSQVTSFKEKTREGKTVFEIKHDGQEKIVALKSQWPGTRIELVRVQESGDEAN